MRAGRGAGLIGAVLLFAACTPKAVVKPGPGATTLEIRVNPPSPAALASGMLVEIAAVPVPATEMQWVSGTVKIFRAPTLPFKKDAKDGLFKFKTMVPPMVMIPAGTYEVKAWGRTALGQDVEARTEYVVK